MRPFWAIVKLTCRNVLRSHIFQLLLLILIMCVAFIPATIQGDGTAQGFIQVSLKFSLFSVALMLALSSVWSGCMIMTQDIDGYQLHMVITKPVSRIVIWLAKATGIFFIHALLLAIASILVYVVVMARYNAQLVPPDEIERVANEIRTAEAQANSMPNSKERDVVVQKINELKDIQKKLENSVAEDTRIRNEVLVARRRYVPVGTITDEGASSFALDFGIELNDEVSPEDMKYIASAVDGFAEKNLLRPSSVNESGFSVSWSADAAKAFAKMALRKYGIEPNEETFAMMGLSVIKDASELW